MLTIQCKIVGNEIFFLNYFLFQWVGSDCGHHSTYTFYKGVKYASSPSSPPPDSATPPATKEGWRVLSLGQFFFVKIWTGSDLLSVAELQLLWEDKERHHHHIIVSQPHSHLVLSSQHFLLEF